jgi:phosphoribosylglycinamide formyltransferase-1
MRKRLAVLVSGGGTNLQAILDAAADPTYPAEPVVVLADRFGTGAVERAVAAGIETLVIRLEDFADRHEFTVAVAAAMEDRAVDFAVTAGYLKVFDPTIYERWSDRIINTHPALLPLFPGYAKKVLRDTLTAGVKVSGATIHFLDEGTDTGPIILQEAVPVLDEDTPESLHGRILEVEHKLLPRAIRLFAEGKLRRDGRRVCIHSPA